MTDAPAPRLPRGRHRLSREEVVASQRHRMLLALARSMSERGYAKTSVADVLRGAGVSRETFYQQYPSKLACFLDAFDAAGELLLGRLDRLGEDVVEGAPVDRHRLFAEAFSTYLDVLADDPALARVFLVEVDAAGPEGRLRRARLQHQISDRIALVFDARHDEDRFACDLLVAGVSALVTTPLLDGDAAGLRALHPKVVALARRLFPPA